MKGLEVFCRGFPNPASSQARCGCPSVMAAVSTTAAVCSSGLNIPEETDVAFLLDGSFSVSSAAFASRKHFAIIAAAECSGKISVR